MPSWVDSLIKYLTPYVLRALGLNGFWQWLGVKIMYYGGKRLYEAYVEVVRKLKRDQEQKIAEEKHNAIVSKPDATVDEVGKSYSDLFNSGRK